MNKQNQSNQKAQIITLLFFTGLISIGLFVRGWKDDLTNYIHLAIILLFLTLIINQLTVWKIRREGNTIWFSNMLGLNVKELNEKEDYQAIDAYISYHPYRDNETGEHVKLMTKKGTFRFNAPDYKDFNQTLELIFQHRTDLKIDVKNKIKKQRKTHIDQSWIYYLATLVILVISYVVRNVF